MPLNLELGLCRVSVVINVTVWVGVTSFFRMTTFDRWSLVVVCATVKVVVQESSGIGSFRFCKNVIARSIKSLRQTPPSSLLR
jgi:hypothetical protein